LLVCVSAFLLSGFHLAQAQTCTPVSAQLLGSADDQLSIWINGNGPYGPINYITSGTGAIPPISIPVGAFNATGPNLIAALNQDLTASVVESSWVIDVTCSNGQHSYITSSDAGLKMYVSPCSAGSSPAPPNDGGGNAWYSPNYASASTYFTGTPTVITGQAAPIWLQPMYNPQTGAVQPWIGMNNTAVDSYGGCTGLYYRETVTLNPVTYTPPTFSVSKSANPTTIAKSYSAGSIAYKLIVCNSGAPVNTPVTVWDNLQYNTGAYYNGTSYSFSPPTQMFSMGGAGQFGSPAFFYFPDGFGGNGACVTISYTMSMGDTMDATTCVLVNQGSVTYGGVAAVGTAAVTITGCAVAVNTSTMTNTNTVTKTQTSTATRTSTPTVTHTQTQTSTPTITNSQTPTATSTNTNSYTVTNTRTSTATVTNTATILNTNTNTVTSTRTFTPTVTNTATVLNTMTNTVTNTRTSTATVTNSATPTDTRTATVTSTVTNTQTSTETLVNTGTFTNTRTSTSTSTTTNTRTPSPTMTSTATNTDTLIDTATNTNTATNTATLADTATDTNTWTVTNTQTSTNTQTDTPTLLDTATPTNSSTVTNTQTSTNSMTSTATLVNTATPTSTWTVTNTKTSSSTATQTSTVTATATSTATIAAVVKMGKSVSATEAKAGDLLTYTLAVTVSGNAIGNAVVTDTPPSNMTFVGFQLYPAGTSATALTNGDLQWVLPSSLSLGVYDLTYTMKVNLFAPASVALVNNAQLVYSGAAPLNVSAAVTVIGNFSVAINIYNSAGEVVKSIPIKQFSTAITNITLSTTNTITTLQGPGSSVDILFDGVVIGTWDGSNNQDLPVANGTYKVQIDNISAAGNVTSISQNVVVNRSISDVEVDIFNQAGEVVRKLYNVMSNPVGSSMTNISLSSSVLKPSLSAPVSGTGQTPAQVKIYIEDSSAPVTLTWDGSADNGNFVTPGEYQIQVHWSNGNGNSTNITRSLLVMPTTGASGKVLAKPNELNKDNGYSTRLDGSAVSGAASIKARVYTLMGELVKSLSNPSAPYMDWDASGKASGLYIAVVEMDSANGEVLSHQKVKILLIH